MVYVIDYEIQRIFEIMLDQNGKDFIKYVGFDNSEDIEGKADEMKIIKLAILSLLLKKK